MNLKVNAGVLSEVPASGRKTERKAAASLIARGPYSIVLLTNGAERVSVVRVLCTVAIFIAVWNDWPRTVAAVAVAMPNAFRPELATVVALWLVSGLHGTANGWVVEKTFEVQQGDFANVWPVTSLGPGGERPFKFVPGGSLQLNISCQWKVSSELDDDHSAERNWPMQEVNYVLCHDMKSTDYVDTRGKQGDLDCNGLPTPDPDCYHRQRSFHVRCGDVTDGMPLETHLFGEASVSVSARQTVNATMRFNPILVSCCVTKSPVAYNCQARFVLTNPDGNQLSADEFGVLIVYRIDLGVLGAMLLVWGVVSARYWRFCNRLHMLLTLVLVVRIAQAGLEYGHWMQVSRTGIETTTTMAARTVALSAKWSLYLLFVMCAGFGMGILSKKAKYGDRILLADLLVFISLILYNYVNNYSLAITVITALLGIFTTLRAIKASSLTLKKALCAEYQYFKNNPDAEYSSRRTMADRVQQKLFLMRIVLVYCVGFPVVYLVAHAVVTSRFPYQLNLEVVVQEATESLFLALVLWFFRLHDCYEYATITVKDKPQPGTTVIFSAGKHSMFVSMDNDVQHKKRALRSRSTASDTV